MKVVSINAVKRCSRCGGSKPLTGRLDRTGKTSHPNGCQCLKRDRRS